MKSKFKILLLCFLLLSMMFGSAKAQESLQVYLEFDTTSTKSEVRFDVVIKPVSSVGAFRAEYEYNPEFLQFKSVSSSSGGKVYSSDENGTINVIYMAQSSQQERVLTLKFKVLKDGDSTVTAYYSEMLSADNTSVEFVNNNDCEVAVTSSGVVSTTKTPSKTTSSSSSGKVSVVKDNPGSVPTAENSTSNTSENAETDFFSFQSDNPAFWVLCGVLASAAVVLIIFTSYRMGVKKAKSEAGKSENKKEKTDEDP